MNSVSTHSQVGGNVARHISVQKATDEHVARLQSRDRGLLETPPGLNVADSFLPIEGVE